LERVSSQGRNFIIYFGQGAGIQDGSANASETEKEVLHHRFRLLMAIGFHSSLPFGSGYRLTGK